MRRPEPTYDEVALPKGPRLASRADTQKRVEPRPMNRDDRTARRTSAIHWTDWLSGHAGWTVLVAGGVLCAVALILS